jgi:putative FmdB family regulatory protein
MPIYEYVCTDCGTRFDTLRSMRDADLPIPCKQCDGEHAIRVISVCYSQTAGRAFASAGTSAGNGGGGCVGCSGGSCSGCRH